MTLLSKFAAQHIAFENAYKTGDWDGLRPFFTPDCTYEVMNISFHCVVEGLDAVLHGFDLATKRFDKKCDRTIGIDASIHEEGNRVMIHSGLRFVHNESPPIESRFWEIATYRDGRIHRLLDIYDPGNGERFDRWMATWGKGLDPRYIVG